MSSTKRTKLPGGYVRESKRYSDSGVVKSVTYKPTWWGRDTKSVSRSDGKKR